MNEERYSAVRCLPTEFADKETELVSHLVENLSRSLLDEMLKHIAEGEAKVVMLSKVKTTQGRSLGLTSYRQDITVRDLVFCKDCKYWIKGVNMAMCSQQFFFGPSEDWFCADGERREYDEIG